MKDFFDNLDLSSLKEAAPMLLLSAFLSALLVLGVLKLSGTVGRVGGGSVTVAVFDVVKFANAQRAVASQFIGKREEASGEAGTLLLALSKKTNAAIEKVAGPGTLVLVKQGVVSGSQVDITDDVLKELGLPTEVPTQEPMRYLTDVAPTMLFIPSRSTPTAVAPAASGADQKVLP
jgi:hypothetical protein